ncbi:MAG: serine/threonine-protein kinase [Balneolaceae bacterium]|nr:serine/threonine-protein kinase [Balneolaceae bacterium]
MHQNRWNRIETILDTALTLSENERTTYINNACQGDGDLIDEVYEMLEAIEESEQVNFLKKNVSDDNKQLIQDFSKINLDADIIGTRIGAFQITEQIGSGGMGAVYKADRVDGQFSQQVAIKMLQKGIQSENTIRRFRMEQEILASLKHPNIAQLYDGGVTNDGVPYLVMEYVDGNPIDEYCNKHKKTIKERIELFKDVCLAVQFAHANLVIHRDLKAQNIYVTEEGRVKVLDFGIAKLMDPDLSEQTLLETRPGQKFWTPQYAAPEQVKGENVTISVDVYALGVLLHKLLTDTYPLDLSNKSLAEVQKTITETTPVAPSSSLKNLEKTAKLRQTSPASLKKTLTGDLDALVLKSVRKEPEYRYDSVSQLTEDLERFEKGLPILARKDTISYRIGKFYRRNKVGIVTALVVLILLIGSSAFYAYRINQERLIAESEAAKAEEISNFLIGLFEASNPFNNEGGAGLNTRVGTILESGIGKMDSQLENQPEVNAELKTVIGEIYKDLGEFELAEQLFSESISILETNPELYKSELAVSTYKLAHVYQETGNLEKADSLLQVAIANFSEVEDGFKNKDALEALSLHGNLSWFNKGDFDEAEKALTQSLHFREKYYPDDLYSLGTVYSDLANLKHEEFKLQEADSLYQKALDMYLRSIGENPNTAIVMSNYSMLQVDMGNIEEAENYQRRALEIHRNQTGEESIDVAMSIGSLAKIHLLKKEFQKADSLAQISISKFEDIYGPSHIFVAITKLTLAKSYLAQEKHDEALNLLLELNKIYQESYPTGHPRLSEPLLVMGDLYTRTGAFDKAIQTLNEAYTIRRNSYPSENWKVGEAMNAYGNALSLNGSFDEADSLLNRSYNILRDQFGDNSIRVKEALARLENHNERMN